MKYKEILKNILIFFQHYFKNKFFIFFKLLRNSKFIFFIYLKNTKLNGIQEAIPKVKIEIDIFSNKYKDDKVNINLHKNIIII